MHTFIIPPLREEPGIRNDVEESQSWIAHTLPSSSSKPPKGVDSGFPRDLLVFQQQRDRCSLLKSWPQDRREGGRQEIWQGRGVPVPIGGQELALCP